MFDILETIQSQYGASPKIKALVLGFYGLLEPSKDIKLFYDKAFNLDTAEGTGLDSWGRIVAINRKIENVPSDDEYLGFVPINTTNPQAQGFNVAPFYNKQINNTYILGDEAYRLLILTKAMANISTGSLPELNHMVNTLIPNVNIYIIHIGTMRLRIVIQDVIKPFQKNLLIRGDLPPIPAGVGFEVLTADPYTFGFFGSNLQPFNQGVFVLGDIKNATD